MEILMLIGVILFTGGFAMLEITLVTTKKACLEILLLLLTLSTKPHNRFAFHITVEANGCYMVLVSVANGTKGFVQSLRFIVAEFTHSDFGTSAITVISSAFANTRVTGQPHTATYSITFPSSTNSAGVTTIAATHPQITAKIVTTGASGARFNVTVKMIKPEQLF